MTTTILCIERFEDTREWVRGPSGAYPLPGTGRTNDCARCGVGHEVHVHVLLSDGRRVIVGTVCATREDASVGPALDTAAKIDRALRRARIGIVGLVGDAYVKAKRRLDKAQRAADDLERAAQMVIQAERAARRADRNGYILWRHDGVAVWAIGPFVDRPLHESPEFAGEVASGKWHHPEDVRALASVAARGEVVRRP